MNTKSMSEVQGLLDLDQVVVIFRTARGQYRSVPMPAISEDERVALFAELASTGWMDRGANGDTLEDALENLAAKT